MPQYNTHVVYCIKCNPISKVYIGQTRDEKLRRRQHFYALSTLSHPNNRLQDAYTQYGITAFTFSVIERNVSTESINRREKYWIDYYDSARTGFNLKGGDTSVNRQIKTRDVKPHVVIDPDVLGTVRLTGNKLSTDIHSVEDQIQDISEQLEDIGDTLYWCFVGKHTYFAPFGRMRINSEGHMCCNACYAKIARQLS